MLEQCCDRSKQCPNNVATLCCAKGRCCESSRVISPSNVQYLQTLRFCFRREDLRNWPFESYSWQVFAFQYWWKGKMEFFFLVRLWERCGKKSMNTFVFSLQTVWNRWNFSSPCMTEAQKEWISFFMFVSFFVFLHNSSLWADLCHIAIIGENGLSRVNNHVTRRTLLKWWWTINW